MSYSSKSKSENAVGCFVVIGVLLVAGLIHSAVRYFIDRPTYEEAHAAYLAGECDSATTIYNEVIDKFHLFDFGSLKAKSRTEKNECILYSNSLDKGVAGLYQFVSNHPTSDLAPVAKTQAGEIIKHLTDASDLSTILGGDICQKQEEFVSSGWLPDESTLTRYMYYCAKELIYEGEQDQAFEKLSELMKSYPSSDMAGKVMNILQTGTDFCPYLPQMSSDPAFNISSDALPDLYLSCGRNYDSALAFDGSVEMYQDFLDNFPSHPSAPEVEKLLAAALINQARASGAGTIERPDTSGNAPSGIARVVIQNDSPHDLKLVFSGPDALIQELPACGECQDYSTIGPMYCPEKGPIGTYELTPGSYEVLVETTNEENITPFTGTWELEGGNEFYSCFFVVTRFY